MGFGLIRLPEKEGKIDMDRVCHRTDASVQAGTNSFDAASAYHGGNSEKAIQEASVR